jgi:hypothetical protein
VLHVNFSNSIWNARFAWWWWSLVKTKHSDVTVMRLIYSDCTARGDISGDHSGDAGRNDVMEMAGRKRKRDN